MSRVLTALAAGLAVTTAASAQSAQPLSSGDLTPIEISSTVVTQGNPGNNPTCALQPTSLGCPNNPRYNSVYGSERDAVVSLRIFRPDLGGFVGCTGSLLPNRVQILTAAHCVSNTGSSLAGSFVEVRFQGPDNNTAPFNTVLTTPQAGIRVHPSYTGNVVAANDVAILDLPSAAPAFTPVLPIFSGPAEAVLGQQFTITGYGSTGSGYTGDQQPGFGDPRRRFGFNRLDATANPGAAPNTVNFTSAATGSIWIADFDFGDANFDSVCRIFSNPAGNTQLCNQGVNPNDIFDEVGVGRGDSGGPALFNGAVVGVASWGGQFFSNGRPNFGHGTIYGYTNLLFEPNATWLAANITGPSQVVPEPSTYVLLATGLAGVLAVARRRRA